MIPKILTIPVSIAVSVATGVARAGFGGVAAAAGRLLPGHAEDQPSPAPTAPTVAPVPTVTPARAAPAKKTPAAKKAAPAVKKAAPAAAPAKAAPAKKTPGAKKAPAKKAPAKKAPAKKAPGNGPTAASASDVPIPTPAEVAARTKPAAALNEDLAPVGDDPVVYSTGPDSTGPA